MIKNFIGQDKAIEMVNRMLKVSKTLGTPLPNLYLDWPPGYGKDHLFEQLSIAMEWSDPLIFNMGATAKKDFGRKLFSYTESNENGLIVFNEAHAIAINLQNAVLDILEPRTRHYQYSSGFNIDLSFYSFGVATTDGWRLSKAFKSRCSRGMLPYSWYSASDILDLLRLKLGESVHKIQDSVLEKLVPCTRYEPRIATDVATYVQQIIKMEEEVVPSFVWKDLGIQFDGIRDLDIEYMRRLSKSYVNSPGEARVSDLANLLKKTNYRALEETETILNRLKYIEIVESGIRRLTDEGRCRIENPDESSLRFMISV